MIGRFESESLFGTVHNSFISCYELFFTKHLFLK
jgi:hypothetical protein